jgi:hypothetical protein
MTGLELPFCMWAWPGPNAAAEIQEADNGHRVLAIFLDPANLVLLPAPFPNGELLTVRFLRQLARACAQLSAELDPGGAPIRQPGAHQATSGDRTGRGGSG